VLNGMKDFVVVLYKNSAHEKTDTCTVCGLPNDFEYFNHTLFENSLPDRMLNFG
jgi:hypothetical protein